MNSKLDQLEWANKEAVSLVRVVSDIHLYREAASSPSWKQQTGYKRTTACGATFQGSALPFKGSVDQVTCGNCRRTRAYNSHLNRRGRER